MSWEWEVICQDTLDNEVVKGCFGHGRDTTYLDWILSAWGWTMTVSMSALVLALVVGSVIGVMRTLPDRPWLGRFATAWVELFRNIPLLVQLFLWFFVVPQFVPVLRGVSPYVTAVLALGLFTSARIAEQLRAGLQSLPRGQRHAGMALGMSTFQYYRYVLLPMAYRVVLPALTNESMNIIKNSAAAFAVSVAELSQFYYQASEDTKRGPEIFLYVLILYVISALAVNRVLVWIEKKTRVPGFVAGAGNAGGH